MLAGMQRGRRHESLIGRQADRVKEKVSIIANFDSFQEAKLGSFASFKICKHVAKPDSGKRTSHRHDSAQKSARRVKKFNMRELQSDWIRRQQVVHFCNNVTLIGLH